MPNPCHYQNYDRSMLYPAQSGESSMLRPEAFPRTGATRRAARRRVSPHTTHFPPHRVYYHSGSSFNISSEHTQTFVVNISKLQTNISSEHKQITGLAQRDVRRDLVCLDGQEPGHVRQVPPPLTSYVSLPASPKRNVSCQDR